MRHHRCVLIAFLGVGVCAGPAFASPFLPASIAVGAAITGHFSYSLTENPSDSSIDPAEGAYRFLGIDSAISVIVAGNSFSSAGSGSVRVQVSNGNSSGTPDFIQIFGTGDATSFAPFLTGFARQNPALQPDGEVLLNFRFPFTHLSSDSLPASIDPLATQPHPADLFTTGVFGQVEGNSRSTTTFGTREWAFFFSVNPADVVFDNVPGLLSGSFNGIIVKVDDNVLFGGEPAPIPEPSTFFLVGLGALGAKSRLRQRACQSVRELSHKVRSIDAGQ